jgi:hypothetical protein
MNIRSFILFILVVLPGFGFAGISTYYLFPEWATLDASHRNFMKIAKSPSPSMSDLYIASAAENRHRINCFAEGVGVLLGFTISAIGIHGMCSLSENKSN